MRGLACRSVCHERPAAIFAPIPRVCPLRTPSLCSVPLPRQPGRSWTPARRSSAMTASAGRGRGSQPGSAPQRRRGGRGGTPPPRHSREPAVFESAMPGDGAVAIMGGGLSGLSCAIALAEAGVRSVVFDTGEHGVGGRMATRTTADDSLAGRPNVGTNAAGLGELAFDHAAQFFTASEGGAFARAVAEWERRGWVARWDPSRVGHLTAPGVFRPLGDRAGVPLYVGVGGMRALAERLVGEAQASGRVEVRRPCWVGSMAHSEAGWRLAGRGRDQGTFAAVAIAHNGKCANRLLSGTGADDVERQMRSLRLSSIWALMVAFDAGELCRAAPAVAAGMEGAFIGCAGLEGSSLAWVANNTAKLGTRQGRVQCWTLLSTDAFGKAIKVPQESVPAEAAEKVRQRMLADFGAAVGAGGRLPAPLFWRVQMWGAALPTTALEGKPSCVWDPAGRVGICGDWLSGASMQCAWDSGRELAERIAATRGRGGKGDATLMADLSIGLRSAAVKLVGEEIGQFPGLELELDALASLPQRA